MDVITQYEDILRGAAKRFKISGDQKEKESSAIKIFRYAFSIIGWGRDDIKYHLNDHVIQAMHLDKLLKYIYIPSTQDTYPYLANLICPSDNEKDQAKEALSIYRNITRDGDGRFPKGFFTGEGAEKKLSVLCMEYISTHIANHDIAHLYGLFADSGRMNAKLKQTGLYYAYRDVYITPLDFFHYSLPADMQNIFLYHAYTYKNAMDL